MKRIGLVILSGLVTLGGLSAVASADEHKVEPRRVEQVRGNDDDGAGGGWFYNRWRSEEFRRYVFEHEHDRDRGRDDRYNNDGDRNRDDRGNKNDNGRDREEGRRERQQRGRRFSRW
jgi:hypothetical protein